MTKSKTIAAALAALTLATTFTAIGGQAQAHPHFGHHGGWGIGAGIVAGTLIGAAAASNAYAYEPVYSCRYVGRYDRWGNWYRVKVCDVPY
ncbi:MAG TPA: hypothetical protein VGF53_05935 [Pseudolabrys sp.]